ncbi:hypothetical protein FACHB389_13000 [Nostoc calcicola FACHB-389]|nr:hypothetical protein FACHB389_13000 [Nostoc calcicola FACHB-389]
MAYSCRIWRTRPINSLKSFSTTVLYDTATIFLAYSAQYGSVKGERGKGKGFKYILYPLPLNLFPDHK